MGAKIILTGRPRSVRSADCGVAFEIVAGPPNASTPRGMPVFSLTTYHVVCPQRMWDRGHLDRDDRSDVIVEGYLEPRVSEAGQPYVAVVATALTTRLVDITRKARELLDEATGAEKTYQALCSRYSEDAPVVQAARAEMEQLKTGLARFCEANRELLRSEALLQKAGEEQRADRRSGSNPFPEKRNGNGDGNRIITSPAASIAPTTAPELAE